MIIDKLKLYMGRPIVVSEENNLFIKQPLVKDVVDLGEDNFKKFVNPFILTIESIFDGFENLEEISSKYDIFELFFIKGEEGETILDSAFGEPALELLKNSLRYFMNCKDIQVLEMRQKLIIDNHIVDKKEFARIRKIIQEVTCKEDIEIEKAPKDMTKRQKDIWLKLKKGRMKKAEKDAVYMQDIINYVSFGSSSYIPPREIDEMTYYQLYNAYRSIVGIDSYKIGFQYKLSPKFEVKEESKHWLETIKIGK
ncbi:AMP-binding protein [Bacillus pumilus]|uniref:AMP-binding protein n=1 Tax=Bacillus pumilus TaxID=1408 RepID=UPI0021B3849D|nr:AMP-binding protein [Bacillus pumilus]